MAREMVARILDEGISCTFVLADALYGSDYQFRGMLEERGQAYVLAIRSNHVLRFLEEGQLVQTDPATLIGDLEAQAWQPLSAGEGAKGVRLYEWVRLPLNWPGCRRLRTLAAGSQEPA
jgi:SRSO17 transposase